MSLSGKKLLILVENGYQDLEFWYPKIRLTEEVAEVIVAGKNKATYQSEHGYPVSAELSIAEADPK